VEESAHVPNANSRAVRDGNAMQHTNAPIEGKTTNLHRYHFHRLTLVRNSFPRKAAAYTKPGQRRDLSAASQPLASVNSRFSP
jgi:hypothetical protein